MPTTTHRWRAFALLAVANFMTIIDLTIVNVAMPTIGRKLGFDADNLSWIVTAYGITFGGLLLLAGRAADLLGRRRVFMTGLTVFTAASLACGLATDDTFLIIVRAVQGVGAATVLPAGLAIVMNMFREGAERNKALGVWGALGPTAAAVGVITGGLLVDSLGWRYIFFLNVPIGLLALVLAPRFVPESRLDTSSRRYDIPGGVTITAALMLTVYGIATAPQHGWQSAQTISTLMVGAILLVGFFVIEAKVAAPLLPLRLLRNRHLSGANAVALVLGGSFFPMLFVGALYMQQVLGYTALQTGFAWLAMCVASLAFAGPAQMLVTRLGVRPMLALGMVLIAGGVALAIRVPTHGRYWADLAAPLLVTGAGTAFAFIPISIAGLTGVTEADSGLASGLINTTQQLGGIAGRGAGRDRRRHPHLHAAGVASPRRRRTHRRVPACLRRRRSDRRRRSCARLHRPAAAFARRPAGVRGPGRFCGGTVSTLATRTVVVVGASRGLGRATAETFAADGATVIPIARSASGLLDVQQLYPSVVPRVGDAVDPADAAEVIRRGPNVVVLVAGATPVAAPFDEQSWEDFSRAWETDVRLTHTWLAAAVRSPLPAGSRMIHCRTAARHSRDQRRRGSFPGLRRAPRDQRG